MRFPTIYMLGGQVAKWGYFTDEVSYEVKTTKCWKREYSMNVWKTYLYEHLICSVSVSTSKCATWLAVQRSSALTAWLTAGTDRTLSHCCDDGLGQLSVGVSAVWVNHTIPMPYTLLWDQHSFAGNFLPSRRYCCSLLSNKPAIDRLVAYASNRLPYVQTEWPQQRYCSVKSIDSPVVSDIDLSPES